MFSLIEFERLKLREPSPRSAAHIMKQMACESQDMVEKGTGIQENARVLWVVANKSLCLRARHETEFQGFGL